MAKKKSTVNSSGNYTKPGMRKRLFNSIKAGGKGGAHWVNGLLVKLRCLLNVTKLTGADINLRSDERFNLEYW